MHLINKSTKFCKGLEEILSEDYCPLFMRFSGIKELKKQADQKNKTAI